jgi:hypothetical protein
MLTTILCVVVLAGQAQQQTIWMEFSEDAVAEFQEEHPGELEVEACKNLSDALDISNRF